MLTLCSGLIYVDHVFSCARWPGGWPIVADITYDFTVTQPTPKDRKRSLSSPCGLPASGLLFCGKLLRTRPHKYKSLNWDFLIGGFAMGPGPFEGLFILQEVGA